MYLKSENTHKHVITRNNSNKYTIYQMKKKLGTDSILREENIQWENIECIIYCKWSI